MLGDGSSQGLDLALVGVVAASVTTLGLVVRAMLKPLLGAAVRIEDHVNGVGDDEQKLGAVVREGFAKNDEQHRRLGNRICGVEEKLDSHIQILNDHIENEDQKLEEIETIVKKVTPDA